MRTKLRLVEPGIPTVMQKVGRKSDADYGRADRKYLRPALIAKRVKDDE